MSKADSLPPPRINKVVDVSLYINYTQKAYLGYALPSENWIHKVRSYAPIPGGLPDPDLQVTLFVNGIMWPAYQLFLGKTEPIPYDPNDPVPDNALIGEPNIFARPKMPLALTRGKTGSRDLPIWAAPEDAPGRNLDANPPRGEWGGNIKEYPPDSQDISNNTNLIYLPKNKWVRMIIQDGGPMVHPFHIHGQSAYYLGSLTKWGESTDTEVKSPQRPQDATCTVDSPRRPLLLAGPLEQEGCNRSAAAYMNAWGTETIPPVHERVQPIFTAAELNQLNTVDPPLRDMMITPPHGWVVWQFYTGNPGPWFFHCHLEFHVGTGMALAFMVGDEEDDWLMGGAPQTEIINADLSNCPDTEFEGPIQFWRRDKYGNVIETNKGRG